MICPSVSKWRARNLTAPSSSAVNGFIGHSSGRMNGYIGHSPPRLRLGAIALKVAASLAASLSVSAKKNAYCVICS